MAFMRVEDVISGKMGKAYATINGEVHEMLYLKNIEGRVEKKKVEIPVLGKTGTQHKAGGWSGTGTATVYYATSKFRELMLEYIKTGKDTYFDILVENEDPTSNIGKQTVILKGVNLDSAIMAKLDIESETLDEEISFTFNDVDMPNKFNPIK
ncbi:phage tail tube protein [Tepidimicrobium xylanilyticum]|uniref:Phage tail tube protein n=1 Tax=Tepidimicrobium xylanilyticum TaxID=1123352 RepID=A0A1H3EWA0_9FIRM|nr:phage tail tube protein [Tepidimicrobium xylanilyticum]SDX83052.1 Phage tail tube protein [Tepidimicrobium xylanilyticum]